MPTRSVYLDNDTNKIATDIMSTTGHKLSYLFSEFLKIWGSVGLQSNKVSDIQDFLRIWRAAGFQAGNLAIIQDCSVSPIGSTTDPYSFRNWVSVENTRQIMLVGITMRNACVTYASLWRDLLVGGVNIRILLQGGLESVDTDIMLYLARLKGITPIELQQLRCDTDQALAQVTTGLDSNCQQRLEVRRHEDTPFTYSAVVIWRKGKKAEVDIQIHPYVLGYTHGRGARFINTTNEDSRSYAALIKPIADLWTKAKHISANE